MGTIENFTIQSPIDGINITVEGTVNPYLAFAVIVGAGTTFKEFDAVEEWIKLHFPDLTEEELNLLSEDALYTGSVGFMTRQAEMIANGEF